MGDSQGTPCAGRFLLWVGVVRMRKQGRKGTHKKRKGRKLNKYPRTFRVGFVADKVAVGQFSLSFTSAACYSCKKDKCVWLHVARQGMHVLVLLVPGALVKDRIELPQSAVSFTQRFALEVTPRYLTSFSCPNRTCVKVLLKDGVEICRLQN